MTTYAYARVSTDTQSLESQLLALTKAGIPADRTAVDDAVSGTVPALERPGMQDLLSHVRKGDTVVAYSLSRLGRSTLDVLGLLQELERRGVAFRSVTEALDTSTPMGRMMLTVMAAFAQLEREMLVERTRAGMAVAKAKGRCQGRVETPGRREAVDALLAEGKTIAEVARALELPYNSVKRMAAKIARPAW